MKILLHSATELELNPIMEYFGLEADQNKFDYAGHTIEIVIGGVGILATAFSLSMQLAKQQYDIAISIGIVGSYNQEHHLGQVVQVISDCLPELGADEYGGFKDMKDLGLAGETNFPFNDGKIWADVMDVIIPEKWMKAQGLTVNTVNSDLVNERRLLIEDQPELESMEGAAFFYSCLQNNLACIQLKSVSNYVHERNKSAWKIDLALGNLAEDLGFLLSELKCRN